ncbi:52 kDa repressor of the inhibitor of the protein kinase-like isoform X1 [Bacillus rossius redtenbacheri]|uniref:52 kDa repressor of the inhibitor of the protein kinase-like isoform X1 n=1 Tax=Bacillus rossius redtenbacheri TaxID=93214 RepID=UPI002FDF0731
MYTSPTVQNEIITIIGTTLQETIVNRALKANYFTVLADETSDVQRIEQFSLCIRYVDPEVTELREDFLSFVPVYDVSGAGLANTIKKNLVSLGLDMNRLRGQGYDGASAMKGEFRGVQAIIAEEYPKALYTHCASHCLNLCLNDSSKIPCIRNSFGIMSEVCNFFRASPHRIHVLKTKLNSSPLNHTGLIKYCETRWVERHEAVSLFVNALLHVIEALEHITDENKEGSAKAQILHKCVCDFSFIISLKVSEKMLSLTYSLSQCLQSKSIDLATALSQVELVGLKLADMRSNSDEEFENIFKDSLELADVLGVVPAIPRCVGRQKHRENYSANSPKEYFRRMSFIPYIEEMSSSLSERFLSHKNIIVGLQCIIPVNVVKSSFSDVETAFNFYADDLTNTNKVMFKGEWDLWKMKWKNSKDELPKDAITALKKCEEMLFPNLHILLEILASLPVTTASVERSFSTLKRLKTYLRNSTGEDRLNGLALISIHRSIPLNEDILIEKFAKKNRRMLLV